MNQRTHAWLAIRAVALLDDTGTAGGLVSLLKPHVQKASIGAWIPDMQDAKKGSGDIDNHVLKMKPYKGDQAKRFTMTKAQLLRILGPEREMSSFLREDRTLGSNWWAAPYKADPAPGQHLANRAMALTTTLTDLLILGDTGVARLVPGEVSFAQQLDPEARTRSEQVAMYAFMLSHFVADSCMPCHCDARTLSAYAGGLHKELEEHWAKAVGTHFEKAQLLSGQASAQEILASARAVDRQLGLTLGKAVPGINSTDVWKEAVAICRASFAIACIMAPVEKYPLAGKKKASFDTLFAGQDGEALLASIDKVVLQDAVLNIAIVWSHLWGTFGPER
jgi:hypothetical protein